MGLIEKMKKMMREDERTPDLIGTYRDMLASHDKKPFIRELQKAADLIIREVRYQLHSRDMLLASIAQENASSVAQMVQCAIRNEPIDKSKLKKVVGMCEFITSKEESKVRREADLSHNAVLYEALINNVTTAEFIQGEISTALRNGNITATLTEDGLRFKSKAFPDGTIQCAMNGDIKDKSFYADYLTYEKLIERQNIDIPKLAELNMTQHKKQIEVAMDIEH